MTEISWQVSGPPVGKQRPRTVYNKRLKRVVTYTPGKTRHYEESIRFLALQAGVRAGALQPPYALEVRIWWPDRRRRDADNVVKAVADALNGIAWQDDAQVTDVRGVVEGVDRERPRVQITVRGAA